MWDHTVPTGEAPAQSPAAPAVPGAQGAQGVQGAQGAPGSQGAPCAPGAPAAQTAPEEPSNGVSRRDVSRKTATQLRSELNRLREERRGRMKQVVFTRQGRVLGPRSPSNKFQWNALQLYQTWNALRAQNLNFAALAR